MTKSFARRVAGLEKEKRPVGAKLTLGQFLEGFALAIQSPYPLWLLRKYRGRYVLGDGTHLTPAIALSVLSVSNSSIPDRDYLDRLEQMAELFHLLYQRQAMPAGEANQRKKEELIHE